MCATVIVIGYGNELRGDDGIGQRIANSIESWHLLTVKSFAVHQLTPELAVNLAKADLAIFVDACINSEAGEVQVKSLLINNSSVFSEHQSDPQSLLALTQSLYGYSPPAWLVTVPGVNFELRDSLSPIAEKRIGIALTKIINIINRV
ncbi:hydrogenase maturation protease [Anabaena sp. PCC 7108]|uniref:hydrogenase maturation protease n=1 Tax=Anabaena sp. PCC 7108 TaxID=163908 RepID=UPI00034DE3D0|nr:hydrogenase maturation protease [Anabaena sp. PCC 7108]